MGEQQALLDSAATLRQQLKALQRMARGALQIAADLEERLEARAQPDEEAQHELDYSADPRRDDRHTRFVAYDHAA